MKYKRSKRYEGGSIRGDQGGECWNWSPPVGPTANWSLDLAPWSGAQPKTRLVGPHRVAYKKEVGTDGSSHEVRRRHCSPPQNPNPIREGGLQRREAPPRHHRRLWPATLVHRRRCYRPRHRHHVVSARRCPSADPHRRTRGGSWRKKVTFLSTPSRY